MKYIILIAAIFLHCKRPTDFGETSSGAKRRQISQFRYKYFKAVARSGLRLREAPNLTAKKIHLIPYQASGEIIEALPEAVTIDKRKGFWLKVKHGANAGWIFSGYALLSNSLHETESDDYVPTEEKILSGIDQEIEQSEWQFKPVQSINGTEILLGRHGDHGKDPRLGNLFFKKDKRLLSYHIGGYEIIEKVGFPLPNAIITSWVECTECCAEVLNFGRLYLFSADKIHAVDIQFSDQKAECGDLEDDIESLKPEIVNKWSPDRKTLYQLMRYPHCEYYDENKFLIDSKPERKHFIKVEFTPDKITVEDFKNTGIPEKYKHLWTSGTLTKVKP